MSIKLSPNPVVWRADVNALPKTNNNDATKWGVAYSSGTGALKWNNVASTAADGDWIEWDIYLSPGTWELSWVGITAVTGPKVQVSLDGANIGDLADQYSASTTPAIVTTVTGIAVTYAGKHTLRYTVNGRNASNTTGWIARIQDIGMRKTAPP